ncbi:MAG: 4-(cytidine 5'-diphospho)-2-C-methyl-D-erythritol kinase [Hyphomicrobiales bacterium]|nr:4-(cytidine 5'-diphospho)-2-C-methyl-D-erythritol kinase [Hyphomicrobiales bacterium]
MIAAAGPTPSATQYVERARAKINLSLTVLGRRPDGYHELESLVAFADLADTLTLDLTRPPGVTSTGQFAHAIEGANLVERALDLASNACPGIAVGHVAINKVIPVAAGLGGGSADAAAALRLLPTANPGRFDPKLLIDLALQLGSDVPVCLAGRTAIMRGRGETLTDIGSLPRLPAVLVKPGVAPLPGKTGAVFARWAARGERDTAPAVLDIEALRSASGIAALIDVLAAHPNDLEPAARGLMPEIGEVLSALADDPAAALVRLSGAGPTCFALCHSQAAAEAMADRIRSRHPHWWVVATSLGP